MFDPYQNAVAARLVVILWNMGNAILTRCAMQQAMNAKEHRTTISLLRSRHTVFGEMVAGGVQYSVVVIILERDGK